MKKQKFIIAMGFALVMVSCSENAANETDAAKEGDSTQTEVVEEVVVTINGDWQMSDLDLGIEIPEEKMAEFEEVRKEMIAQSSISINEDGTMTMVSAIGDEVVPQSGTYIYEKNVIQFTYGAEIINMKVLELTENKLILETTDYGDIMTMTYTK